MTTAVETPNGRVRKTLASQLDRLDQILDGLSTALNESVADAVERGVARVLTEILTNPDIADRLRAPGMPPVAAHESTDSTSPPPPAHPGSLSKMTGALRAGCGHVKRACGAVVRQASVLAGSGRSLLTTLFNGRLLALAGALAGMGLVVFFAGPRLPLLITAAVGWVSTLIARTRTSLRPSIACRPILDDRLWRVKCDVFLKAGRSSRAVCADSTRAAGSARAVLPGNVSHFLATIDNRNAYPAAAISQNRYLPAPSPKFGPKLRQYQVSSRLPWLLGPATAPARRRAFFPFAGKGISHDSFHDWPGSGCLCPGNRRSVYRCHDCSWWCTCAGCRLPR